MPFITKLDFSDNRQVKQRIETIQNLSGATTFGIPFSALPTGPDLTTTGFSETYLTIASTFSGNSGTTIYSWYDSRMELGVSVLSAITPSNSATTQNTGQVYSPNTTTFIDDNLVVLNYSGVSFDLSVISMIDLGGGNYSGTVATNSFNVLSADTLYFTGRTIWNDTSGITRTERLIITDTPIIGYVWTCVDSEGMGEWLPSSGGTSGGTSGDYYTTGATLVGSTAYFDRNDTLSAYTLDLSTLSTGGTSYWSASTGTNAIVVNNSDSLASGINSLAEGFLTTASGYANHAEGIATLASGDFASHAEGRQTTASGSYSHAEGSGTTASRNSSHAEGIGTKAIGDFGSHAGGFNSMASGDTSFVHGNNSIAVGNGTIVLGDNITGTTDNTTYVEDLVIDGLINTDPIATDADGRIVAGTSDARLKENIKSLTKSLDIIKNLRGVSFEYTKESNMGGGTRYGFIAQEVQKHVPLIVRERAKSDGMLSLNYTEIVPILVEAVKELSNGIITSNNTHLETQTILAEDNNIDLNYSGTTASAIGGGITVLHAIGQDLGAQLITDNEGNWVTNNDFKAKALTIPTYTPTSSNDETGSVGNITRDDNYLYIKTANGWKRSNLESF
jgi:hypothetical protein